MYPLLNVDIAGAIAFIGYDIAQVTGVGLAVWTDGDFDLIFAAPTSTSEDKCEHNSNHGC
jgi:hypothetical protein